jgi:hypothetical protein
MPKNLLGLIPTGRIPLHDGYNCYTWHSGIEPEWDHPSQRRGPCARYFRLPFSVHFDKSKVVPRQLLRSDTVDKHIEASDFACSPGVREPKISNSR